MNSLRKIEKNLLLQKIHSKIKTSIKYRFNQGFDWLLLSLKHMYTNFISSDGNLKFYRIPGVLQRFGVCYLFVAMMQLLLTPMNNKDTKV